MLFFTDIYNTKALQLGDINLISVLNMLAKSDNYLNLNGFNQQTN